MTAKVSHPWFRIVVIAILLVVTAAVAVLFLRRTRETPLVVASYGGVWQSIQRRTMFTPFAEASGAAVRDIEYDGQYAKIKEMVNAGHVEWDVVEVEGNMVLLGAKENILEPIDFTTVPRAGFIHDATNDFGVGVAAWSWVFAAKRGVLSADQLAHPWQAFFDARGIPGARGMRDDPRRTLEIALLADGVAADRLYPLDIERAFNVLTRFRADMKALGHPIVWWTEYSRPVQLLQDGEVLMTPAANGRLFDALKEGLPADFTWHQGILDMDWLVVPKGTSNKQLAMRFIAFATSPEVQANAMKEIAYGPVSRDAFRLLPPEAARQLPTQPDNLRGQIVFATQWWADHDADVRDRWNAWRTN